MDERRRSEETEMHHKQSATERATKIDHHLEGLHIFLQSGRINKGGLEEKSSSPTQSRPNTVPNPLTCHLAKEKVICPSAVWDQ